MNKTTLEKLEYNEIKNQLSSFCNTYLGRNLCLSLSPSTSITEVQIMLKETDEATKLIYANTPPPIEEIADNTINLKTLKSSGILTIKSLLEITKIFIICNNLKKYFYKDFIEIEKFNKLDSIFSLLYSNNSIMEKISKSIIDEETIADNASKNLFSIRKKQKNISEDLKNKLNSFIHSSTYSKYIQENIITIRNGRFVIPIKAEYRTNIKGFIHDVSSSGSTIFIEPFNIFELNNELNNLKLEENIEIEKILKDLTSLFYPYIEEIETDINCIQKIDFIFAKAKYAKNINGIIPIINSQKYIDLKQAKHPLLDLNNAVPISINLGKNFDTLVITGPNTGGKTVALKTIGLLNAMACSGLCIPAKEGSSIFVFDSIFADIGDNQSIMNSLSTFSSHMTNIIEITKKCTNNSLVLIDELGSGTDPVEGSALAISILNYFKKINCLTVATTHYQELKKYASLTDGFENASVEFDVSTLSPTYKLLIGVPGKSNAFEISKKLGLNIDIISEAKSLLSKNETDFEELLKSIYDDKIKIENEKISISKELQEIKILKNSLEEDNSKLLQQKMDIINNAKIEARNILIEAKDEANELITRLKNHSNTDAELENLRNKFNEDIKNIKLEQITSSPSASTLPRNKIKPNVEVFVTNLNQNGIIVSNISKSNEVQVQVGNIRTSVNISNLAKAHNNSFKTNKKSITTNTNISKTRNAKSEINIIGLNVEEAILIVDKFLDDASLAKLETVRIIHGKGTGKLRKGIHEFLKTHSQVESFRIGTFGEGEIGVTIVTIKK